MAKVWADFLDEILPEMRGTPPQSLVTNAVRNAAIEFCERSYVLRMDHPAISAAADTGEYTWSPGTGLKVVRAEEVWYDGKPLTPITVDDLKDLNEHWTSWEGTPLYFVQERVEMLTIVPYPADSLADAIEAKVSVKPSRSATGIDDAIWEKYLEVIASGAKARLFAMSGKPWTNEKLAVYHKGMFDDGIDKARLAAFKGHVRSRNQRGRNFRRFV